MVGLEKEVVITYETLFEFLRLEKSRPELQKLSVTFFEDVLGYIGEKLSILDDPIPQTSLFASAEKEKTRRELENIGRILKELYDRREKKILEMAMIKSRTDTQIIDTSHMLIVEKELFETLTQDLQLYRAANLNKLLNGQMPQSASQQASKQAEQLTEQEHAPKPETTATEAQNPNIYKSEVSKPEQEASNAGNKVQFLEAVDEIVGPDLQIYGPFESGSTADLPKELATALINTNQAKQA